ncbi:hypothetical protein DFH09DRAFT_1129013 [Mycena vulgaris]|nr:hypothetical protein DFH09DRAFT_1129013 [Mycena vulgaris]
MTSSASSSSNNSPPSIFDHPRSAPQPRVSCRLSPQPRIPSPSRSMLVATESSLTFPTPRSPLPMVASPSWSRTTRCSSLNAPTALRWPFPALSLRWEFLAPLAPSSESQNAIGPIRSFSWKTSGAAAIYISATNAMNSWIPSRATPFLLRSLNASLRAPSSGSTTERRVPLLGFSQLVRHS